MTAQSQSPGSIGGRYRIEELLGRGATGEVYRVVDTTDDRTLAIKRLVMPSGPARERAETSFASEYQVLSEIDHPRVVSVHDYGRDDAGPFYVMDLIEGEDLRRRAPMPWREACAVLHDLCTSLALLHSRRLVHRDVTPRNVRLDDEGRAVLLDFGTMVSFGPTEFTAGTPPYVAPEVVHGQRVDERTDLYSLGAVGYFLLTGRDAYPAQDWRQLRDLWRSRPVPPAVVQSDVPPALDQLITSLMSLVAPARPRSAAEVMDRLRVVAQLPGSDVEYAQSFLASPSLFGRDEARLSFRKRMVRAMRGRGSSILVHGETGSGRSRLLESHVLEGKLVGALVMQASAQSSGNGQYATVLTLLRQFRDAAPDFFADTIEPHLSILGHISPELQPVDEDPYQLVEFSTPDAERTTVQRTLVRWIRSLRQHLCVLVVVDDLDQCDALSAAVIVELADPSSSERVVVVASAHNAATRQPGSAAHQLGSRGARCLLRNLSRSQTGQLIESIFGTVPRVEQVADWVFQLSAGNPGLCMRLAQHLADRGVAQLEAGRWVLPNEPAQIALPQKLDGALEFELRSVGDEARTVAQLIALTTPEFPLELRHYRALSSDSQTGYLSALEELRRAGIVVSRGGRWDFPGELLRNAARKLPSTATRQALHYRLADAYEACDESAPVVAHHLLQAGEPDRAYDRMGIATIVEQPEQPQGPTAHFYQSRNGIALLKFGLEHAERRGLSERTLFRWRNALLSLAFRDPELTQHASAVLERLQHDTGLCYLSEIDPELPAEGRIQAMFGRAHQAHADAGAAERGLAPAAALGELVRTVLSLVATYTRTWETDRFESLVQLFEPLRSLSPTTMLVHDTLILCHQACTRGEEVRATRRRLFEIAAVPVAGLDEQTRHESHLNLAFFLGLDEANTGSESALELADVLDASPSHRSLAQQVRFIFYLAQGNVERARDARADRDLYALGEAHGSQLAQGPLWESLHHYGVGDLIALRNLRPHFEAQAALYPGWKPWQLLNEALYQMLHDDYPQADALLLEGCALAAPLQHCAWQHLSVFGIEAALGMGDDKLALERTEAIDRLIADEQFSLLQPAGLAAHGALALARTGQPEAAVERIDACLKQQRQQRSTGVQASLLYEARARVVLLQGDGVAFDSAARRVAAQYRPGQHPGLLARYERLMDDAAAAQHAVSTELASAAKSGDEVDTGPTFATALQTLLGGCQGADERAVLALQLLVERTGGRDGFLYGCRGEQPLELLAQFGKESPGSGIQQRVHEYFQEATGAGVLVASSDGSSGSGQSTANADDFEPHLLWRRRDGVVMIAGVAVLRIPRSDERLPFELLSALADALLDAGDVLPAELP